MTRLLVRCLSLATILAALAYPCAAQTPTMPYDHIHLGVPDPAAVNGSREHVTRAYRDAFVALERRIGLFLSLPLASIDRLALKKELEKIGQE